MNKWRIVGLLACLCASSAYGLDSNRRLTQYMHRIWQSQQGLPPATIRAITQSHDGYLWLGTDRGLVRFDGVRFTVSSELGTGLPQDAWVRQVVEDSQHDMWVGTANNGVFRLHDGVTTRFSEQEGLPSNFVQDLLNSKSGALWVCTPEGLVRIRDGRFQIVAKGDFEAAVQRKDGTIWAGGSGLVLTVWDGKHVRTVELHSLPKYATVQAMLSAHDESLWIGTSDGLIRLAGDQEKLYTKADGLANDSVLSLAEGQDGSIWIGTVEGFSRYRGRELETFGPRNGLSQSTVYAVMEDREGSLWVGTKRGLNQFLDRRTIPITTSEGLPSNDTGPVLQDGRGNIWVGTLGAGLERYDGHRSTVFTTRDGLSSNSIQALALDGQGGLWVGTQAGLDHVADGRVRRVHAGEVSSLQEGSGQRLWIGTNSGAAVLQDGRVSWLKNARVPVLALGEAGGRIYAATQTAGVLVFSQSTLEQLPAEELSLRDVDAFYTDTDGSLWLGTTGSGLALLNGGKLVGFSMRDGLFDDDIYGIASDDRGRLWLACSKGIFSVDRADLKNFAAGKIKAIPSTPYSPLDGLQTVECKAGVQPGAWRMRNGYISFSTIRGLLLIDPNHIEPKMTPPLVVIEAVTVDGRDGTPSRMPEIEAGERNLQFGYTGVSFRSPTRLTFRYKLEGFDHNWIEAGTRREAFYTNLPPGSYRFLVSSCNYDGTCSEIAASVVFTLPARFYQRPWFWPACVLFVALLTRLAYSIRIKQLKRDFNLVLAERGRIARELHDTLIQGFSGVTMQMQALAARLSPEHKSKLHDIIEDSAGCLREARRSVANLRNSDGQSGLAGAITQAAKQSVGSAGTHLRLHLDPIADRLAPEVEYNLVRIAQEAVTNAVKHSGAATIDVRLMTADSGVRLSIRDDGRGFVPSPAAGHYGLVGMQERARSIGAELQVKSEVGKGTTVSVKTPVRAARAAAKSESSWATERL